MRLDLTALAAAALLAAPGAATVVPIACVPGTLAEHSRVLDRDAKHRVWLLDARSFEVFEVTSAGFSEPSQLEVLGEPPEVVPAAAMGDSPDDWLLFVGVHEVRRIEDGREVLTEPLPWLVSTVAFFDGEPAAFTLPAAPGGRVGPLGTESPWLMTLDSSWRAEIAAAPREDLSAELTKAVRGGRSPLAALRGEYDGWVAKADRGGLWLADTYRHRVRRLARSGRVTTTLTSGGQEVGFVDFSAAESALLEDQGVPHEILGGGRLRRAIEAVAEARDGKVYVLGSADVLDADRPAPRGDLSLFRFDPVLLTYEAIELDFERQPSGRLQMVAGRDGLFVLAYTGGLYFVPWLDLEGAEWPPVADVQLDGRPLYGPVDSSAAP